MATNSTLDRNAILAARQALQPVREGGWLGGFGNLFGKEMGEWLRTRRWLWQTIIWLAIINGVIAFIIFLIPAIDPSQAAPESGNPPLDVMALTLFFFFAVIFGSIGMVILAQDEVIQEKQSGTAAWILSKPVSRPAFILAKLLSNVVGGLIFIVALPALVIVGEVYLAAQHGVPILPFLMGLGAVLLTIYFYLCLTVMLGVLFQQRGPGLGIAFGVMLGGLTTVNFVPQIAFVLPVQMHQISFALAQGQPLPPPAIYEIVSTAILSLLFIVVALWRFEREEF